METLSNKNDTLERIERTRRKMSALKIQTWYRKHLNKRLGYQDEIQKLFAQKKVEMKKKIEQNNEKNLMFNNINIKKSPKATHPQQEKRTNQVKNSKFIYSIKTRQVPGSKNCAHKTK